MEEAEKLARFNETVLPHLDAAYNLARWMMRNEHDAEDIVQEACYRALKYFSAYRGENSRAWLLAIVRNTGYDWIKQNRPADLVVFDEDEERESVDPVDAPVPARG
jgi:RNA polymerase sigma-70 factor (ECF subfamily)